MDSILRHLTIAGLADMFARNEGCSPAPHLVDPANIQRARKLAKANGVWDAIGEELDADAEIPVLKRSHFRDYRRTGRREVYQDRAAERRAQLGLAANALWLGHPAADVDYLQDHLWAWCDEWTWVLPAHEHNDVDLASSAVGAALAEIVHVLGDRLEDEVIGRVHAEVVRRVLRPVANPECSNYWHTRESNWNHVCNGSTVRAALYVGGDPTVLAQRVHPLVQNMTYALDGFTDDGGCTEGPGYWGYGFGHYMMAALALRARTGGELDIMRDGGACDPRRPGKIERICRYPLAANIEGKFRSTFADSQHGRTAPLHALLVNQFYDVPELLALCPRKKDGTLRLDRAFDGGVLRQDLALDDGKPAPADTGPDDALLADMGQVRLRGRRGRRCLTLMALAGHNAANHNHNDVGSFLVHRDGRLLLVDPGGPRYTNRTFGPHRYEIVYCSSRGHSVPVINGRLQAQGRRHEGFLTVEGLNGDGLKRATIEMARAYPRGTVKRLVRTFTLDASDVTLDIEDIYEFSRAPESVEEAFITLEETVVVAPDGASVRIGPKRGGLTLSAVETPGTFAVERLVEESKEGRTDDVITRITFTPAKLAKSMALRFRAE